MGCSVIIRRSSLHQNAFLGSPFALFEGQPVFRVVDEDLIHLVLWDAPHQHLRHYVLQDVRVAVAAELGETVLGVDVVRDHYLVFVALLHKQRQAEREQRNVKKSTRLTILGKEHAVIVNLPSRVVKSVFCMWPECESWVQPHSFITPPVDTHSSLRRRQRLVSHSFCEKKLEDTLFSPRRVKHKSSTVL